MENKEVYIEAIKQWGDVAQVFMFIEEVGELLQEISKQYRGKSSKDKIAEELADVQIMLEQMTILFNAEDLINTFKYNKINRLKMRLKSLKEQKKISDFQ